MLRLLSFPYRLAQRRISVQLIYSQLLVVVVTVILLEFGLVVLFLGLRQFSSDAPSTLLIARANAIAFAVSQDVSSAKLSTGDATLETVLRSGAAFAPSDRGLSAPFASRALFTDAHGVVLASTDRGWAAPGEPVSAASSALAARLVQRTIDLQGQTTTYGNRYLYDYAGANSLVTEPVLDPSGALVGVVAVAGPAPRPAPAFVGYAFLVRAVGSSLAILAVVAIPALLVSIPVGIWRARSVSGRLTRLEQAADDLASGKLDQQVAVQGDDEIARLGRHFNEVFARLHQADRARKAFIANVSHELRTPLTIIQGTLESLPSPHGRACAVALDPHTLETLRGEAQTLNRLVDDLFTLARLEEATLPLEPRPLDVPAITGQVVDGVRGLAWEQRQVVVRSIVPAALPAALGDETRLRQILGNLLHNAIRHTPEGGLVVVSGARAENNLVISVSDTGVGIPPEQLPRVFDRFFQTESARREAGGSGLGLAIVKDLVEAQGGVIAVESTPGQGTSFCFTLPLA